MNILYILYYILVYIQHNGDVWLEKNSFFRFLNTGMEWLVNNNS